MSNKNCKHDVIKAFAALRKNARPGDIININGYPSSWNPLIFVPHSGIRAHQKALFGLSSHYLDTHTTTFFDEDHVFSVTTPRARWETLVHQSFNRFTLLRYVPKQFTDMDISWQLDAASKIIGTKYDYGQLLDIAINKILGYPHIIKYRLFDLSKRRMVCSVGSRTLLEHNRYELLKEAGLDPHDPGDNVPMKRLFDKLNMAYWSTDYIKNFKRVDVEATSPAHFRNSDRFSNEFRMVLCWQMFL